MTLLLAPAILVGLVGLSVLDVGGGMRGEAGLSASSASAVPTSSAPSRAVAGRPATVISEPTPTLRADWPAAIGGAPRPAQLPREDGTDGLMGRLPFGLSNDTPTIRAPSGSGDTDFSSIYDERAGWAADRRAALGAELDTTPPWVRRLGGLANFRTDPYER